MEFITGSAEETTILGKLLGKELKTGVVMAFEGDLGSGKTTFIQGLAKGLGIHERIISPTFVLMRRYEVRGRKNIERFYHMDLYRIHSKRDLVNLDFEEIIRNPKNVVAVEWAERVPDLLPNYPLRIQCGYINNLKRKIRMSF